ncbi:MAG: ABC transporter permease [Firmicutes bacterium]|nr:ABC transporter permease [Bacillota bacterium]
MRRPAWRRLTHTPGMAAGVAGLAAVLVIAVAADVLAPADPLRTGAHPLQPPSWRHPMGTDDLGRDLWANVAHGARASLLVGGLSTALATLVGVAAGALAGLYGRVWDEALMRLAEVFHVVPRVLVAFLLIALFGGSLWTLVAVIAVTGWPAVARVIRSEVLSLRERDFALAARALGASDGRLLRRHVLPNAFPPVLISLPLQVGRAILLESGLSFLGLGDPGVASWGRLLQSAQGYMRDAWWLALFPGLALTLTVLAIALVAEAWHLRSAPALVGYLRHERAPRPATPEAGRVAEAAG